MTSNRQAALKYIDTFTNMDVDTNIALRSNDCRQHMAPASVGHRDRDNEAVRGRTLAMKQFVEGFDMSINQIWEGGNVIVVWCESDIRLQPHITKEFPDAKYHGEYIFTFEFNEEGKIKSIIEFVDSKAVSDFSVFREKIRQHVQI